MERVLYKHDGELVHTEVIAILEFGKFILSGHDQYKPTKELPEGSEYEYETLLDSISTSQLKDVLAPNETEDAFMDAVAANFSGERATILFQAFCLKHEIETYCNSFFED